VRDSLYVCMFIGACVLAVGCVAPRSHANGVRVIVLGVDGMDPQFVQRHWSALPNLSRLRLRGDFKPLATTVPPQSPVAWSTFITGMDPDGHGIYDFVRRNPQTYLPVASLWSTENPKHTFSLGPYLFSLPKARVVALRQGKAFWQILAEHGIPVTIIRMPTNYPPIQAGQAIAGMGTPDLLDSFGTFTFYTDDPEEITRSVNGGRIVKVPAFETQTVLRIDGAANTLRQDQSISSVDLSVTLDPKQEAARLTVDGASALVPEGQWSGWLHAKFPLIPGLASAAGMFRVYVKELRPRFQLYVSPVNIDPEDPEFPISAPADYSRAAARAIGPFYTLGIAEDTSALRQNVLSVPDYLVQSRLVFEDEHRLLGYALDRFHEGLLFVYFSSIDQNSHMLWDKHEPELLGTYRAVDAAIGELMDKAHGADVIVMSDHGFTTFGRAVNLNTWLWKHGYLGLEGAPGEKEAPTARVDWSRTTVYALGLQSLYLNLAGREKEGIVSPGPESQNILRKLRDELLAFRDGSKPVVESVYAPPRSETAPDLIVGYARDYRVSWHSALAVRALPSTGELAFVVETESLIDDNHDAWIGDHCIDAREVPGVLFSGRKILVEDPQLKDLTVSILRLFGVGPAPEMSGRTIL